jgi:hypothetical protein
MSTTMAPLYLAKLLESSREKHLLARDRRAGRAQQFSFSRYVALG